LGKDIIPGRDDDQKDLMRFIGNLYKKAAPLVVNRASKDKNSYPARRKGSQQEHEVPEEQ
jgi:hypothetical protein